MNINVLLFVLGLALLQIELEVEPSNHDSIKSEALNKSILTSFT